MFEKEVKALLNDRNIRFKDGTRSTSELDFFLPDYHIHFDAKERPNPFR